MEKRKPSDEKLNSYHKKRNFSKTQEPKGEVKKTKLKRFVVQYHQARAKHYDFRIEHDGVLLSWAVPKGLSNNPKIKRLGVMVEDHPIDYIDFEGIIPKGNYGAGTVEIFDQGNFVAVDDLAKGLKKGHIKIVLNGKKLKGGYNIVKTQDNQWLFIKNEDEFSGDEKTTKSNNLPFSTCSVQLATLSEEIPKSQNWIFEIKYDGYRILAFKENKKTLIKSRNGVDYTKKFPVIASELGKISGNFVVDGEVVVFDENGKSDFGLLQEYIKFKKGDCFYVIFDLLALNEDDLRCLPLKTRKEKLERLLFDCESHLIFSQHVNKGKESFDFAQKHGLEGIVAKDLRSLYSGKRSEDWLKIKCYQRQEFVIAGFSTTEKNEVLGALLVGYYKDNNLIFAGKVGTGFGEKEKTELKKIFEKYKSKASPFKEKISQKDVVWLKPKLVCEVQFAELTKNKILRQPSFVGLRDDKDAKDVVLESDNEKH